ncbi:MAG: dethiobiotin synthase [Candidatus Omnitrophota bacterium]|nr:dethiobiotin synthase [Candidatus Omnitrophota bacterium]MBU1894723.1 dethiobiotin synthase [Candidatus Omnitrophota bacterium]
MKTICKSIFVAGTDTGVGKTLITGMLGRMWMKKGIKTVTQKWVQTGSNMDTSDDIYAHMELMKTGELAEFENKRVPYRFKFPASPHLAARVENKTVETKWIKEAFFSLRKEFEVVLIEGTGGVMVPFNEKELMIDLVETLDLSTLVIAANRLGAVNQTLLTLEALKKRDIRIIGVIFNRVVGNENEVILKDNLKIVEKISGIKVFGELTYCKDRDLLYEIFEPIGEEICAAHGV